MNLIGEEIFLVIIIMKKGKVLDYNYDDDVTTKIYEDILFLKILHSLVRKKFFFKITEKFKLDLIFY